MKRFLLIGFGILFTLHAYTQTDTTGAGVLDQALVPARILAARHEYNENNMRGALTIYREVLDADPTNVTAMYGIAQCHYRLKKYRLALDYLDRSVKSKGGMTEETIFFYAQCYHRLAELDKAIDHYKKFMVVASPRSFEYQEAMRFIKQCEFAKNAMQNPADVSILNMGEIVNSRFEEYAPSVTADGNLLVFTSRRSGELDSQGDYKYYEDIFFCRRDPATNEWGDAERAEGGVNTETHDAVLSITPDGGQIFVYKNNGVNAGDIFISKKSDEDKFREAIKMDRPINTSYFEGSISMTSDGKTIYFVSERPEGLGLGDIYVSSKKGDSWSNPKSLGNLINTDGDEKFVFIHPNGKTLFFASDGHLGLGSYDIFRTELVNGEWSKPVNLGYPINTVNEESTFSLTGDNQFMFIAAEYKDNYGDRDIYQVDISRYEMMAGFDKSTYGQLLCIVTNNQGKGVKDAIVEVWAEGNTVTPLQTAITDKLGYARINLKGNKKYRVRVNYYELKHEEEIDLQLRDQGDTVLKLDVQLAGK
jgi:tetratricopeptide (TPR) repeat protein